MMNTPLVTVVTVCLNVIQTGRNEMFLQCVESVRRQTYPRIEHLIIDGASTDGTIPLLQSLNLSFFSEKDTGIYDAMNKGIARGKGEYVLFLNTDDFFHSRSGIEESVRAIEANHADYSYAYQTIFWDEQNDHKKVRRADYWNLLYRMPFCHQSMLCRRDVLLKEGMFDTRFKSAGDYDFILRLFLKKYIAVEVKCDFVTFRIGGESSNNISLSQKEMVDAFEKNYSPYVYKTRKQWETFLKQGLLPFGLLPFFPWDKRCYRICCTIRMSFKVIRRKIIRIRIRRTGCWIRLLEKDLIGHKELFLSGTL